MRRAFPWVLALCLSLALFGCGASDGNVKDNAAPPQSSVTDDVAIASMVKDFGGKLQLVSLLAPKEQAAKSIQEHYASYVSPTLLASWKDDPEKAPGRLTSSPWPDRIEVSKAQKLSEDAYEVRGEIIEVTSVEKANGGAAAKRPITLSIKKVNDRWLIDAVTLGDYLNTSAVVYQNFQYGFRFSLPASWRGYTIITTKWEGYSAGGQTPIQTGPMISIRHPQWTSEQPRQDIPILVFTLDQWKQLQDGVFHIGAAPIGPRELGRNDSYVFALPARYNYAFPLGYEEVEEILKGNPLQPSEIASGK